MGEEEVRVEEGSEVDSFCDRSFVFGGLEESFMMSTRRVQHIVLGVWWSSRDLVGLECCSFRLT